MIARKTATTTRSHDDGPVALWKRVNAGFDQGVQLAGQGLPPGSGSGDRWRSTSVSGTLAMAGVCVASWRARADASCTTIRVNHVENLERPANWFRWKVRIT